MPKIIPGVPRFEGEWLLSDAQIKALKPLPGKRYNRADTGGLPLDITSAGIRTWIFRYRLNGQREKVIIGRYPEVSLKDARGERDKLAAQVRQGKSPFMERKLARAGRLTDPSVREFGELYYKEQVLKNWKDPKQIRRYLDNEIYPVLGIMRLKDVYAGAGLPQTRQRLCSVGNADQATTKADLRVRA